MLCGGPDKDKNLSADKINSDFISTLEIAAGTSTVFKEIKFGEYETKLTFTYKDKYGTKIEFSENWTALLDLIKEYVKWLFYIIKWKR